MSAAEAAAWAERLDAAARRSGLSRGRGELPSRVPLSSLPDVRSAAADDRSRIPAVVGIGNFLSDVSGGAAVIIDGTHGEVIIDPDDETRARYRDSEAKIRGVAARLESLRALRSETRDKVRIHLMGNIEFPEEVEHCTKRGADGIGLYRTEFLYLDDDDREPTEEDHYQAYRRVVAAFAASLEELGIPVAVGA